MEKNNLKSAKELLDEEVEKIENVEQKERIKFLLNDYSQPKFKINAPIYVLFITLICCFFWQNLAQKSYIKHQEENIEHLIFYIMYMSADVEENDSTYSNDEPYEFEQIQFQHDVPAKVL